MDRRHYPVDAALRKLSQNVGRGFMICLSRLDGFSHYIWDFCFKFLFELVKRSSYLAVPVGIMTGQAVDRIAFDAVH